MRNPTTEQKAKAAERRERFRALAKQVADMPEEARAQILMRVGAVLTCDGRQLSLTNTMLLVSQCPTVSLVGGFRQWIKAGRAVRKGEHGHMIWVPLKPRDEASVPAPVEPNGHARAKETESEMHFMVGTVFDVSQTQEIETGATP